MHEHATLTEFLIDMEITHQLLAAVLVMKTVLASAAVADWRRTG